MYVISRMNHDWTVVSKGGNGSTICVAQPQVTGSILTWAEPDSNSGSGGRKRTFSGKALDKWAIEVVPRLKEISGYSGPKLAFLCPFTTYCKNKYEE